MKLKELQRQLKQNNLDSIAIFNFNIHDPAMFYFTGIELEHAFLLVKKDSAVLFTKKLEMWRAEKEGMIKNVKELPDDIKELRNEIKGNIGLNFNAIPVSLAKILKTGKNRILDASSIISGLRETKTEEEISRIRKACKISDVIIESCIANFKQFRTERDAKAFLKKEAIDKNCDLAFPPIVASGRNAALPHYSKAGKLQKRFCIIDFGVKYKGYCSDTTRTVFIGNPSAKEKELYEKLLKCQKETTEKAKEGETMESLEKFARKQLGNLEKNFIHRLGHSVGIEVHDPLEKTTPLEAGMVVTIEPGIYLKNKRGMRIEDTVLITKKGNEKLTKVSKKLRIVN